MKIANTKMPKKAAPQRKAQKKVHKTKKQSFATFKKVGKLAATPLTPEQIAADKEKTKAAKAAAAPKKVPTLNDLMRHLYKKIHPDLMMAYPQQREVNDKSLSVLQAFLSALKDSDGNEKYPVLRNASIPFYLRTSTPGHFQHVELLLHSEATLNKKLIEQQLSGFFKTVGVGGVFKWDDEYFPLKTKPDFKKNEEEMQKQEQQYNDFKGGANDNESYDEFMSRMKREAEQKKNAV